MPVAQKNTSSEAMSSSRAYQREVLEASLSHRLGLGVKLGIDAGEKLSAKAAHGACRHDAFRRAAGSHQGVDA